MTWKLERWSVDIHKEIEALLRQYGVLRSRELVIVACAALDLGLAELLSLRLIDNPSESESFLGLNEDGRAPGATFGARIQLAYLTGVIPAPLLPLFRGLKALRNAMAHRVNIDLLTPPAQRALDTLRADLGFLGPDFVAAAERSRTDAETAHFLVLNTFAVLNHGLRLLHGEMRRLQPILTDE